MPAEKSLFAEHRIRSVIVAFCAAAIGHVVTHFLPATTATYFLMQTAVAVLALCSASVFIVLHHRNDGRFLTQTQEEMILITAFGFFWFAMLLVLRVYRQETGGIMSVADATRSAGRGFMGRYGCQYDDPYCVVEEEWGWY